MISTRYEADSAVVNYLFNSNVAYSFAGEVIFYEVWGIDKGCGVFHLLKPLQVFLTSESNLKCY